MAKAKKPASSSGTSTGKADNGVSKSTGSVPKASRSKPTVASAATVKTATSDPTPDKASVVAKPETPEPNKTPDKASTKPDAKPVDTKPVEKPEPVATKTPEPSKVEPKSPSATPAKSEPKKSGSIFMPLLIGGVLAAALGFLASEMNLLGTRGDTSDLRAALSSQQAQITELQNVEPQTPVVDFPELDDLTSEITVLSETVSGIDARLTEVEKRPMTSGASTASVAAYERELAALQTSVEEQRSEIEGLLDNALSVEEATAEAARNATLQAAMTRITAAINSGKPFASALADLTANGLNDVPTALTDTAESGVVTLINLQTRFPQTARTALSAARANGTDDTADGLGGFLKRQLGARSVAPREGTDPDAVLSRAEAAVRDGRLIDALAEIDTLPEISQSAMDDWLADARARQAAEAAAEDLSQRLTAN